MRDKLRIGIIGMGGYAGVHHQAVLELEEQGHCRLVCGCDPDLERWQGRARNLRFSERGVDLTDTYETMLDRHAEHLDMVVIPTPIPLHRDMHRACVERGIPVFLEKPPTLDWEEFQAMVDTEAEARRSTFVGFNFIVEPSRLALKKRLIAGEFGALRRVSFRADWPRPAGYYRRNSWAGQLMVGDQLVLDSPLGNACSHFVFNLLFWSGGEELLSWADIKSVRSECYRAHAIESADSMFVSAQTDRDVELLAAVTHTGSGAFSQPETVVCDQATIHYDVEKGYRIVHADGREESGPPYAKSRVQALYRSYFSYLSGDEERPLIRLDDCASFVLISGLIYVAAGRIHSISKDQSRIEKDGDECWVQVPGMSEALQVFDAEGRFPSAGGPLWARPGGRACAADIRDLRATIGPMTQ